MQKQGKLIVFEGISGTGKETQAKLLSEYLTKRHNETGEPLGAFEARELLGRKRAAYQSVLKSIPHIRINADQTIEAIHTEIIGCLHAPDRTKTVKRGSGRYP